MGLKGSTLKVKDFNLDNKKPPKAWFKKLAHDFYSNLVPDFIFQFN
jgi:hypothetical protein